MRVFLAADLPKEIKEYLFQLEKEFKEAKITWVSKKNLHLTLKFIGDVEEKDLPKILVHLHINHARLDLHLNNLGFFPNKKDPRVIWMSIEPEQLVIDLQQKLDAQFLSMYPGEQKFQAHITLGRIKSIRREKDFFDSVSNIHIEKIPFQIDSFQLMKSDLTKNGPVYQTLQNVNLS